MSITHGDLVNLIMREVSPLGLFWPNATGKARAFDNPNRVVSFGLPGSSDILGCLTPSGRMIGIEAKVGRDGHRDQQKNFAAALTKAGGLYILARSTDGTGRDAIEYVLSTLNPDPFLCQTR